jgi:hypothetical protein
VSKSKFDRLLESSVDWHLARSNFDRAVIVGNDRVLLKARLLEARSCLVPEFRKLSYRFDSGGKRLIIGDRYVLQWRIREYPESPESYRNQQTNIGVCLLNVLR